jgi:aspartate aminotransferase-like enzyme
MVRQSGNSDKAPFAPAPIEEVCAQIRKAKPDVVFAPHVETSAGLILPDDYITEVAKVAH